jgi:phenylpyruvate tautomerase PptA (4-oxalocrotonate tautomerase family)
MPVATMRVGAGHMSESKGSLAKTTTEPMVKHPDAKQTNLRLVIQQVPKENGVLPGVMGDKRPGVMGDKRKD